MPVGRNCRKGHTPAQFAGRQELPVGRNCRKGNTPRRNWVVCPASNLCGGGVVWPQANGPAGQTCTNAGPGQGQFAKQPMAKTTTAPATTTALPLAAQLGTRVLTAAQFGNQRPPVTTATRYAAPVVAAILAYAKTHNNQQTKAQYGCSAHYVGKLRKAHGVPLFVAAKAPAAKAPAAKAPAAKAPAAKANKAANKAANLL